MPVTAPVIPVLRKLTDFRRSIYSNIPPFIPFPIQNFGHKISGIIANYVLDISSDARDGTLCDLRNPGLWLQIFFLPSSHSVAKKFIPKKVSATLYPPRALSAYQLPSDSSSVTFFASSLSSLHYLSPWQTMLNMSTISPLPLRGHL